MDFLKILKSFEEFVYEALTWLILFPRTEMRIVMHPGRMTQYAAAELSGDEVGRFKDAISPPLLLILCVLLAHMVDLGIRAQAPDTSGSLASVLLASENNLLLYRTIAFGIWALAGAVYLLARSDERIDRESLRPPFYEQCYLVAPFALLMSLSTSLLLLASDEAKAAAGCLFLGGALWFWYVQASWIRRKTSLPWWRSVVAGVAIVAAGSLVNAGLGHVLTQTRLHGSPAASPAASGPERRSDQGWMPEGLSAFRSV